MKRHGKLFESIASFENLLAAERAAYRGKRRRPAAAGFHFDLEPNLFLLHAELHEGSYERGMFTRSAVPADIPSTGINQ
jgi:hypothetical protein